MQSCGLARVRTCTPFSASSALAGSPALTLTHLGTCFPWRRYLEASVERLGRGRSQRARPSYSPPPAEPESPLGGAETANHAISRSSRRGALLGLVLYYIGSRRGRCGERWPVDSLQCGSCTRFRPCLTGCSRRGARSPAASPR